MYRHASTCLQRSLVRSHAWSQDGPGEDVERACSGAAREAVRDGPPDALRLDLIARVRSEIAAGIYDTPEKWDAALDRLLERLDLS